MLSIPKNSEHLGDSSTSICASTIFGFYLERIPAAFSYPGAILIQGPHQVAENLSKMY